MGSYCNSPTLGLLVILQLLFYDWWWSSLNSEIQKEKKKISKINLKKNFFFLWVAVRRGGNSCHVSGSCRVRAVSIFFFTDPNTTRDPNMT